MLAAFFGTDSEKILALRQIVVSARDPDDEVRAAAVKSFARLADVDTGLVMSAIRSALADPCVEVREKAAWDLGMIATFFPLTRPDVASILIPLLASEQHSRVRVSAAWALTFDVDGRRQPGGAGPDVVPALVAALNDADVEVRRAAAAILGSGACDQTGKQLSSWYSRKDSIILALAKAVSDDDMTVREDSALALFTFGQRDLRLIELLEHAARIPFRSEWTRFKYALEVWQVEEGTKTGDGSLTEQTIP
jgi:HEAT repeat protein